MIVGSTAASRGHAQFLYRLTGSREPNTTGSYFAKGGEVKMDSKDVLSLMFGAIGVLGVVGGVGNRLQTRKGIGTQFIRYIAIVVSLPIAAALAVQGMLTEAAVSVILGALGYAFAGAAKDER